MCNLKQIRGYASSLFLKISPYLTEVEPQMQFENIEQSMGVCV